MIDFCQMATVKWTCFMGGNYSTIYYLLTSLLLLVLPSNLSGTTQVSSK